MTDDTQRLVKGIKAAIQRSAYIETRYRGLLRPVTQTKKYNTECLLAALHALIDIYDDTDQSGELKEVNAH